MRHLNFAKQDSQSSIIEISKYPEYMDSRHEPHVMSTGSIILKEPSVMSNSQPRLANQNINSREFLEAMGGRGL